MDEKEVGWEIPGVLDLGGELAGLPQVAEVLDKRLGKEGPYEVEVTIAVHMNKKLLAGDSAIIRRVGRC